MDPTARGDTRADLLRRYYEAHRETWWDRHRPNAERKGGVADNFMIGFMNEVTRICSLDDNQLYREWANDNRRRNGRDPLPE